MQDSVVVDIDNGPDDPADYVVLKRGKRHDYFTSCLPFPQKGPAVELPIGSTAPLVGLAPVHGIGKHNGAFTSTSGSFYESGSTSLQSYPSYTSISFASGDENKFYVKGTASPAGYPDIKADLSSTSCYADLSAATAATINSLRQAFQLQKLYERDARGGTRYTEIVRSHFGVVSPDARLQRPEYLGGGSTPVNIHPIAQTSSTDATSPQGNLAAFGTSSSQGNGFSKSFTEHCLVIGLVSVRADLNYQQGLNRMFSGSSRFDFYWPAYRDWETDRESVV